MDLRCISADSHIVEPPNCYVDFIDPKFRDTAPRVVRHADGYDTYWVRDLPRTTTVGLLASAGLKDHATWPWSQEILAKHTVDLTLQERRKILRDNVRGVFNLPLQ